MTGEQLRELEAALLDAYPYRNDLERMLLYGLQRRLSTYVGGDLGMREVIFKLIEAAFAENWLEQLIEAALTDRAGNAGLRAWERTHRWRPVPVAQPPPPQDLQLLDSAFFDLQQLKRAVQEAKFEASSRLLAFGVTYSEMLFVNKLCSWLPYCLGEVERKEWLSLRPELAPVDVRVKHVLRYLPDLEWANVVCPVLTDGVPSAVVAQFWDGVREHCGHHERWFVMVFAGSLPGGYPSGITTLPAPQVDRFDLALWAQEVVSRRGWPATLADAWSGLIEEEAWDGSRLDIRLVYESMDRSIRDARQDSARFRRQLEERSHRADPAPR
ncbi:effector-associated domain EAD1-containing protein [Micromonospora yasonensis]|uniref:effector-associated domain EAD1-containing protein n=1 Tax=Micromonospora yasonensis TaxID=1128667 RepID=UPI002232C097|nr:effector-associated domain EAD1-containing protein [Micromonospora yasonensis]MCW3842881.1 effector-associated domain EAD1-containing protein [Micromonospora yasonensis]